MQLFTAEFQAMACNNLLVACSADEGTARAAMDAAQREVLRIQTKYSRYLPDSIVSRINAAAGRDTAVECDQETVWLLACAETLYRESDGLFDITSGVLRRAWDFGRPHIPSEAELAPLLALVGWSHVEWKNSAVRLTKLGMEIDFGGFGKEYACDRAAKVMASMGIEHGFVNLGGDICAIGPQPDSTPWQIGVGNPRKSGEPLAKIALSRGGLATSSDSEKYREIGGRRYSHILNPKTGMPVNCWSSVTVQAASALHAGCFTTIAMLKEHAARAFIRKSNLQALFVDLAGNVFPLDPSITTETSEWRP